jgi:hypothetical protein
MRWFHDEYLTRGDDLQELTWLGKSYDYDNPGPIVAYPPNAAVFNSP